MTNGKKITDPNVPFEMQTQQGAFGNHLTNQFVMIEVQRRTFPKAPVNFGVSKGTVFGPCLFMLYIHDWHDAIHDCSPHMYVDDTVIYTFVITLAQHAACVHLAVLQKLFLNADKSTCVPTDTAHALSGEVWYH